MSEKILVVEDEPTIADTLVYALKTEGFAPTHVKSLHDAQEALAKGSFALVVLDVGLPDGSGLDFCRALRAKSEIPVLMLTARSAEVDRILGLEFGADDYVTKPFSPREVTARIKAILKRTQKRESSATIDSPPFTIDDNKKRIVMNNDVLELGRYEYGLLKLLIENRGRVYSREQLMQHVWADPDMSLDRTVDAHIKMLRQKLKTLDPATEWIITHRGLGYSMKER